MYVCVHVSVYTKTMVLVKKPLLLRANFNLYKMIQSSISSDITSEYLMTLDHLNPVICSHFWIADIRSSVNLWTVI